MISGRATSAAERPPQAHPDVAATTSSRRPDPIDMVVRKTCENSLVAAVCILSTPLSRRRLAVVLEVCHSVERWFNAQSTVCRSVQENLQWLLSQASGKCMQHIVVIRSPLVLRAALSRLGFWLPTMDSAGPEDALLCADELVAADVGGLALSTMRRRLIRTLPITRGWPMQAVRMLSTDPGVAAAVAADFLQQWNLYVRMRDSHNQDMFVRLIVQRSQFARPCVEQLMRALTESGGVVTEQIRGHLRSFVARCTSTTVCEDGFNTMKNSQVLVQRRRLLGLERAMASVIKKHTLGERHRYQELEGDVAVAYRAARVPSSFFVASAKDASLNLKEIIGTTQAASRWSGGVERVHSPIADVALMERGAAEGDFAILAGARLGCLMRVTHALVVRERPQNNRTEQGWFFSLGQVGDSTQRCCCGPQ